MSFDDVCFKFRDTEVGVFNSVSQHSSTDDYGYAIRLGRRFYAAPEALPDYYTSEHTALRTVVDRTNKLSKITVAIMSLFMPGLGQLARGRERSAMVFFLPCFVFWVFGVGPLYHLVAALHAYLLRTAADFPDCRKIRSWESYGKPMTGPTSQQRIADIHSQVASIISQTRLEYLVTTLTRKSDWQINPHLLDEPLVNLGLKSLDIVGLISAIEAQLDVHIEKPENVGTLNELIAICGDKTSAQ